MKVFLCVSVIVLKHPGLKDVHIYDSTQSTSTGDGGGWSSSRPGRFIPGGRGPGTHWVRG